MATDEERTLIAPCGLNCGACPLYMARTDETLRRRIAEAQGVPVERLFLCDGCRPAQGQIPGVGSGPVCDTYACAVRSGRQEGGILLRVSGFPLSEIGALFRPCSGNPSQ